MPSRNWRHWFETDHSMSARQTTRFYQPPRKRLIVEVLEDRTAPATLTVNSLTDGINHADNALNLREAIVAVNAASSASLAGSELAQVGGTFGTNDTIQFAASLTQNGPATVTLVGFLPALAKSTVVNGPGANLLTINGNNTVHIWRIDNAAAGLAIVAISGLTFANGRAGDVALDHGTYGGAIYNLENLTVTNCSFTNNIANQDGGAITNDGTLVVANSTFSGNTAFERGGALSMSGPVTVVNSTLSGNFAQGDGGGVYSFAGGLNIVNSTIVFNRADSDGDTFGAGGIFFNNGVIATLNNSIVAGNRIGIFGTAGLASDLAGATAIIASNSFSNLIGDATTAGGLTNGGANQNIVGVSDIGTVLETTLRDNGGATFTHALVASSIALDKGNNAKAVDAQSQALTADQRGAPFARTVDGPDVDSGATVDIGAYEWQALPGPFVVDVLADESDGNFGAGDFSLREAILLANGSIGADTITFSPALTQARATIVLTRSLPTIATSPAPAPICSRSRATIRSISFALTTAPPPRRTWPSPA